jgi:hypothetical protein
MHNTFPATSAIQFFPSTCPEFPFRTALKWAYDSGGASNFDGVSIPIIHLSPDIKMISSTIPTKLPSSRVDFTKHSPSHFPRPGLVVLVFSARYLPNGRFEGFSSKPKG